ncbi:hypothetical protein BV22DRAFT_1040518 [Leucogyrophana mollusca]|uniref:Uncharacterized protein n=1 Tax=Leucogyrophana mollusca TaxID=85980 RepID=A0ACB8B3M2_9AGAM|nr:hypothetical protein BV22DRAFT_1040518 [Leucogyrophana mollusca]
MDEKLDPVPLTALPASPSASSSSSLSSSHAAHPHPPRRYTRPRGLRIWNLFKRWLPILLYAATSLGFVLAIAFWKEQVFDGLDRLSHWLRKDEYFGYAVLFCLIFLTTIPPLPLYSTLITLSGYTYGPTTGFLISYPAALSGGTLVYLVSLSPLLRPPITRFLASHRHLSRAVRAVSRRPGLLFLVRLAPYPYNVLNVLLAGAEGLSVRTYVGATALSLGKVIVHTSIGAGVRSFAAKGGKSADGEGEEEEEWWSKAWTAVGIMLCIAILVYLSVVARRAVDDELGDEASGLRSWVGRAARRGKSWRRWGWRRRRLVCSRGWCLFEAGP